MRGQKEETAKTEEMKMAAPKGNQFWRLRSKHGRDKLFTTPELLWEAACEYFQWCEDNPLYEIKGFAYQGVVNKETFPKMRAMTLSGLCFYLNCNEAYFRQFKKALPDDEEGFSTIIKEIEVIIYNQKFQGAAADLLNANIIARDLGLSEKTESTVNVQNLPDIIIK
ncbi:MAG: DNA-packaging protein [Nitrospira sp.]|nr:DNA-packaging protein [Nitrospira sp.]